MNSHFLTIEGGRLVAYTNGDKIPVVITSLEMLKGMVFSTSSSVMISSSLHFPEEYTSDADTLEMVKEVTR